ncbi:MAG: hypothetical protein DRP55_03340 [Spirochaetes bacterium]|nr:MAG: hypothetical protein DRP55_03340 [Spirochaetota bacterium]
MKRILTLLLISLFVLPLFAQEEDVLRGIKVKKYPFYIYRDAFDRVNHYIPSGWMGDWGDIKIKENCKKNPKTGKSCFQIIYTAKRSQNAGWAGIYWQNPANNWGTVKGGYDLSKAKKLFFYARGEKGGEIVEFKIGGITGRYSDSGMATTGPIELTKKWKLYEIDLSDVDLSYISGGFCVVFSSQMDPDGCTFYIDEVYYTDKDKPISAKRKKKSRRKKRRR